eukprot:7389743-Prymnesium_polylepis.2
MSRSLQPSKSVNAGVRGLCAGSVRGPRRRPIEGSTRGRDRTTSSWNILSICRHTQGCNTSGSIRTHVQLKAAVRVL